MNIQYGNIIIHKQFLTPKQTSIKPKVSFDNNAKSLYTFITHDPDAVAGNYVHWLIVNIPGNQLNSGKEILEYKGPAPPKGTGTHNYIFTLYEQLTKVDTNIQIVRTTPLHTLLQILQLKEQKPILETYFTSKNMEGGKTRNKRRKLRKTYKRRKLRKTK